MKHWVLSASTALAFTLPAQTVFALTPEEVWESWRAVATSSGAAVSATSETRNGAALEITGIATTAIDATSGTEITTAMERLVLTERGDGTVEVTMSEGYRLSVIEPGASPDKPTVGLEFSQPGATIIASGEPGAVLYEFTTPKSTITLTDAHEPDGTPVDVTLVADIAGIAGKYQMLPRAEGGFGLMGEITTGAVAITTSGNIEEDGAIFSGAITLEGISSASKGVILEPEKMAQLSEALAAGFSIDTQSRVQGLDIAFDFSEGDQKGNLTASLDSAALTGIFSDRLIDYGISLMGGDGAFVDTGNTDLSGQTSFTEATMRMVLPVGVSQEPKDFSWLTRLTDLTLSDSLWGLADPGAEFPRDPITLVVDLSGKAAWLVDIFAGDDAASQMPMELHALDVTEVLLKLVGAEVNAKGALAFDNSDLATFAGMPRPDGKITINLSGIPALLDRLVRAGILSEGEISQARFGLAMFARPGAGPDQLVSEIEFRDGGLYINGQKIM